MFEQRGHFNGLDTCNHVEFGNFEKRSLLRFQNEDRSIQNCYDINAHLDTLCKHNVISSDMVQNMRYSAEQDALVHNYSDLYKWATYVPLKTAIELQDDTSNKIITLIQMFEMQTGYYNKLVLLNSIDIGQDFYILAKVILNMDVKLYKCQNFVVQ